MDNRRTVGIIATIATVLLCGCPGLFLCVFGAASAAGIVPYTATLNDVETGGTIPPAWGVAMICAAVVLLVIPILVAVFTLRNKPASSSIPPSEPLPPAI